LTKLTIHQIDRFEKKAARNTTLKLIGKL